MPIVNALDLGAHPIWNKAMSTRTGTVWGQEVASAVIEGGQTTIWNKSGIVRKRTETWWIITSPPDPVKVLRMVRQLQEIASNPLLQPVYIQWASGGGVTIADPEDGWYVLENVSPDEDIVVDGIAVVKITASYIAPGLLSKALAVSYIGGPATIGWGGPAINWLAYPNNSTGIPFFLRRWGSEGYIPISYSLPMSSLTPQVFNPSQTVSDLFTGKVTVWDTISTPSFPVPTGGQAVNPGWVQVFHGDHQFVGDCVISNDLILLLLIVGQQGLQGLYFWNINTNAWVLLGRLDGFDNNNSAGIAQVLRSIVLGKVSYEEVSVQLFLSTSANNWIKVVLRIIAGSYFVRCQLAELSQSNAINQLLQITTVLANTKITYNDSFVRDNTLAAEFNRGMGVSGSGFGYVASFINSGSAPIIFGWLFQTNANLPNQGFAGISGPGLGDTNLPLINQFRTYAFFIAPFPLTQNLQVEGENGTLSGGFTTVADAAASNGSAAKAPSGTGINAQDNIGPVGGGAGWVPPIGFYDVWWRVRVTSNAGSTPEMTLGLLDVNTSTFVGGSAGTLRANQFSTTYTWFKSNGTTPLAMPVGHTIRFLANTSAILGTDWFIDEAIIVPVDLLPSMGSVFGPRNLFSEFAFDRQTRVVPV